MWTNVRCHKSSRICVNTRWSSGYLVPNLLEDLWLTSATSSRTSRQILLGEGTNGSPIDQLFSLKQEGKETVRDYICCHKSLHSWSDLGDKTFNDKLMSWFINGLYSPTLQNFWMSMAQLCWSFIEACLVVMMFENFKCQHRHLPISLSNLNPHTNLVTSPQKLKGRRVMQPERKKDILTSCQRPKWPISPNKRWHLKCCLVFENNKSKK